jgi:hypothetical protein
MVAQKRTGVYVLCVGLLFNHLFNLNFFFLSSGVLWRWNERRSCGCIPPLTGLFRSDGQTQGVHISMRHCQDFCLKNAPGSEVYRFQVQRIWRPIRRSSDSAKSRRAFLLCGPMLNPLKDVFSIRIFPLDLGE